MPENISTELIPQPGQAMVGFKIFQLLGEILQNKSDLGLPARWLRNYQLAKNKHWLNDTKKATLVSANLLFAHRTRTVNELTDNNPTFNLSQQGDPDTTDREIYDKLLHTAEHWWSESEQQNVLEESVTNGETNGVSIEKVVFNPELEMMFNERTGKVESLGEVETLVIDPYHFGFYPVKAKKIQKAEAVLHYWPMPVREARRKWPEFAEHIKSDDEILKELGDDRREVQGGRPSGLKGYFSTFAGIVKNMLNTSGEVDSDKQETLIVEVWVKDYTTDKNGDPLYPGNIRCIQACSGGHVVLSDRPNPSISADLPLDQAVKTYLFDKFPFSFTQSVTDPVTMWSQGDYEQLEGLQIEIDKTISQLTLFKDKASRLKIINPESSGVHNNQFTNKDGIINPSNAMAADSIRYMEPPKMPADLLQTMEIYKDLFFLVAGTFDLEAAKNTGSSVIAAKAIAQLIERAHTMRKGKIRNYTKMIRERGRMYLSHVMNFYTEDRWITYEDDGEEMTEAIKGVDLIIPAKLGVVSGSTMPVSKIQQREEAIELYDKGAIGVKHLHEKLETANRKNVVKELMQGPLGELMEKLEIIGTPPEMLEVFNELANMDIKEFEKELKLERIPPFMAMLPDVGEPGEDPLQNAELESKQADIQKTMAEVEETMANIALIQEKILSERADQAVKFAGITFDEEQLKIKRAELVVEMQNAQQDREMEAVNTMSSLDAQEHGQEMDKEGLKVDKEDRDHQHKMDKEGAKADQADKKEGRKIDHKKVAVAEKGITAKAQSKGTAPFRDRGTKSDNKRI